MILIFVSFRANPDDPTVMLDPVLADIAQIHGKTSAQVMLRYQIQRRVIVIPKSIKSNRIKENSQVRPKVDSGGLSRWR